MKFLLLIFVLYIIYRYLRRERFKNQSEFKTHPPGTPLVMFECNTCGVHIPQNEALKGALGHYCCQAHLSSKEPL